MQYDIQCNPTTYGGKSFRSGLEARWANVFDLLEWRWRYEPYHIAGIWKPDFELTIDSPDIAAQGTSFLVEVKPGMGYLPDAMDKVERAFEHEATDKDVLFLLNPDRKGEQWWEIREGSGEFSGETNTLIVSLENEIIGCWEETSQNGY